MDHRVALLILLTLGPLITDGCGNGGAGSNQGDPNARLTSSQTEPSDAKAESFTFVRIKYSSPGPSTWLVDYPASDRKFSARFQEVTGTETDPNGKVLELTDPDLKQYPFMVFYALRH